MDGILITVNLPGKLGSRVKHTTKQNYTITVTDKNDRTEAMTRSILHTNRELQSCTREMNISPMVIELWKKAPCPSWANPKTWKKLSGDQKIASFVSSFDIGYGVKYE